MKKLISFMLAVCMILTSNVNITYAATTEEQTIPKEESSASTDVTANISSSFSVTIPKQININAETKNSEYKVTVTGDLGAKEKVTVIPEGSFALSQVGGDKTITATVTQDKNYWNNGNMSVDGNGLVSAPDIETGKWNGSFMFNIALKSTAVTVVSATDTTGTDLNASASAIEGEEAEQLLNGLLESGLIASKDDVNALIDVESDAFDDLADTVFDVSNIAEPGDKVTILHYDEENGEWEYIGTETVDENGHISGDFTSYSPVAFVKVDTAPDSGEHVHSYTENILAEATCTAEGYKTLTCSCGDTKSETIPAKGHSYVNDVCEHCGVRNILEAGLYAADGTQVYNWQELITNDILKVNGSTLSAGTNTGLLKGKLVLENTVQYLNTGVFSNCVGLTDVILSDSVKIIYQNAFKNCTGLTSIYIPDSVTEIKSDGTNSSAFVGANVKVFCEKSSGYSQYALQYGVNYFEYDVTYDEYCNNVWVNIRKDAETVIIPDSVTEIPKNAMQGFNNMKTLIIPGSVKTIGWYAFRYCENLENIVLSEGIEELGMSGFEGCIALREVTIPGSVVNIGSNLFKGCTALQKATLAEGLLTTGGNLFMNCTNLLEVALPSTLQKIEGYAFGNCSQLASITLPSNLTKIGDWALMNCTSLNSLVLPDSVTSIGTKTFSGCTGFTDLLVPDGVTTIGTDAFKNVPHVTYNGSATGSPWGALSIN